MQRKQWPNKYTGEGQIHPPYKQDHGLLFTVNKDNWPIKGIWVTWPYYAKLMFTSRDHQPNKISSILQTWSLYSVNIYKYDIWNGYNSRIWHYFRSGNYRMINIWHRIIKANVMGRSLTTVRNEHLLYTTSFSCTDHSPILLTFNNNLQLWQKFDFLTCMSDHKWQAIEIVRNQKLIHVWNIIYCILT